MERFGFCDKSTRQSRPAQHFAFASGVLKSGPYALTDDVALEFGDCSHNMENQLAGRRGSVKAVVVGDKINPE